MCTIYHTNRLAITFCSISLRVFFQVSIIHRHLRSWSNYQSIICPWGRPFIQHLVITYLSSSIKIKTGIVTWNHLMFVFPKKIQTNIPENLRAEKNLWFFSKKKIWKNTFSCFYKLQGKFYCKKHLDCKFLLKYISFTGKFSQTYCSIKLFVNFILFSFYISLNWKYYLSSCDKGIFNLIFNLINNISATKRTIYDLPFMRFNGFPIPNRQIDRFFHVSNILNSNKQKQI